MSAIGVNALMRVQVRYFAAARAAAGCDSEELEVPVGSTVDHVIEVMRRLHGEAMAKVLQRCSFLLDEIAVTHRRRSLTDGAILDVLPPFAGG